MAKTKYLVQQGLSYGDSYYPPGEIVDDLPGKSVPWLLKDEAIEKVTGAQSKSSGKKAAATRAAKQEGEEIHKADLKAHREAKGTDVPPEEILEGKLEEADDE